MALVWFAASGVAHADIEVQAGTVVAERIRPGAPVITADPFHKFDPMGGTRLLTRVRVERGFAWELVMELANPLPENQVITYSSLNGVWTVIGTNVDPGIWLEAPWQSGMIRAEPFETVTRVLTHESPVSLHHEIGPESEYFPTMIGPGPIVVERMDVGTGFDTFRVVGSCWQGCGAPIGWSILSERWEARLVITYEYTVVPTPPAIVCAGLGALISCRRQRRVG